MVYNLTDYAPLHPGGATFITAVAGTDGSNFFDDFHPLNLLSLIEQYKIGVLIDEVSKDPPAPTESPTIPYGNVEPEVEPPQNEPNEDLAQVTPIADENELRTITLDEIALHNMEDDIWMALHGMVYDLTEYALIHPGGAVFITGVAGTDASDVYDEFHPLSLLPLVEQYVIGVFWEEETTSTLPMSPGNSPTVADFPDSEDLVQVTPDNTEPDPACLLRLITMEEIEQHVDDRWVLIYNRVYDLSTYDHPGGNFFIRKAAGTDATAFFETEHEKDILYDEFDGIQYLMIGKFGIESTIVNICDTTGQ
jgi:cytochrome b involved in lipid metabolism